MGIGCVWGGHGVCTGWAWGVSGCVWGVFMVGMGCVWGVFTCRNNIHFILQVVGGLLALFKLLLRKISLSSTVISVAIGL